MFLYIKNRQIVKKENYMTIREIWRLNSKVNPVSLMYYFYV